MRDELDPLIKDEHFADLYPKRGQPAEAPWRLALVTIMQSAENLTDRHRCRYRRKASHPGLCAGSQRRERLLAGLPAVFGGAWLKGSAIGHQRRPRRHENSYQPGLDRSHLVSSGKNCAERCGVTRNDIW